MAERFLRCRFASGEVLVDLLRGKFHGLNVGAPSVPDLLGGGTWDPVTISGRLDVGTDVEMGEAEGARRGLREGACEAIRLEEDAA